MKGIRLFFAIFCGVLSGCGTETSRSSSPDIQVFCAASLTEVVSELAEVYEARTGVGVDINAAGSGTLARQILAGAHADVFLSASEVWMDRLEKAGRVEEGSRTVFAGNRLVLAVHAKSDLHLQTPCEFADHDGVRLLAMGDPAHVPAGVYGEQWLRQVSCGSGSLWDQLQGRLSPAPDVRAALSQLQAGPDMVALVYATDVAARSQSVRVLYPIPPEQTPEIGYSAGRLTGGRVPEAAVSWMDFLRSREAGNILAQHGFLPGGPHE